MTFSELKENSGGFRGALLLDAVISRVMRFKIEKTLTRLLFIVGVFTLLSLSLWILPRYSSEWFGFVSAAIPVFVGRTIYAFFFFFLAGKFVLVALDAFFYSQYFRGMESVSAAGDETALEQKVSFEVAAILFESDSDDVTRDFLFSRYGRAALMRCGIGFSDAQEFLTNRIETVSGSAMSFRSESGVYGIAEYLHALIHADVNFAHFISARGIQEKEIIAAAEWMVSLERREIRRRRFWSKDSLGRIPGIGKDWAYGGAFLLEKYSRSISSRRNFVSRGMFSGYGAREVLEIEAVLARKKEANALLIGDYTAGKFDIVAELNRLIMEGKVVPSLEHKRIVLLDLDLLIAVKKEKSAFEAELLRLMNDAVSAGNIILVFENLPAFLRSAEAYGSDVVGLLDPYLSSSHLQIIAFTDTDSFHQTIERNSALMQRFEKIQIESTNEENTIAVLEDIVLSYEAKEGVFFTYQAVREIAESAERYFPEGVMPDKAIDLLAEIVPKILQAGRSVIGKEDVLELVKSKTGIAVGEVTREEREKLLNLEALLHARIVGQDEAVKAIAQAMRRARSGIGNENRPIGSFLFLGPTGVGKTETAKALAHTFFGDEKAIVRIDMSEYNTPDALDRLIGSFSFGKVGVLSSKLREKPYGVLLLDEFEKSAREVRDLFLQVLDEGFFSDMSGKRVNCRNLIIIATSNAGSDTIFRLMEAGQDLVVSRDAIIDDIITRSIFRPEFLNRFDGVIIFHPLQEKHLQEVARLMLERLKVRLAGKNIELVVNDELIRFLMRFGVDPKFGGRPMNRAIQEKVEESIARRIIKGDLRPGSKVEFGAGDLA